MRSHATFIVSAGHETLSGSFGRTEFCQQASESVDSGDISMSPSGENGGRRHSLNPVHIPEFLRRVSIGPMMSRRLSLRYPRRKSRSAKTSREEMSGAGASTSQPHLNQMMKRQEKIGTKKMSSIKQQTNILRSVSGSRHGLERTQSVNMPFFRRTQSIYISPVEPFKIKMLLF